MSVRFSRMTQLLGLSLLALALAALPALGKDTSLDVFYLEDGINLSDYQRVYVAPLSFSEGGDEMRYQDSRGRLKAAPIEPHRKQALKNSFASVAENTLGKGAGYTLLRTPLKEESVLIVEPSITEIYSHAPPEKVRHESFAQYRSQGSGYVEITAQLIDAVSGKVIGRAGESRLSWDIWFTNTPITASGDVRQAFWRWAKGLDEALSDRGAF